MTTLYFIDVTDLGSMFAKATALANELGGRYSPRIGHGTNTLALPSFAFRDKEQAICFENTLRDWRKQ